MLADFFAGTVDDWSDPGDMLHAYLVPDAATIDRLRPALRALEPLDFLASTTTTDPVRLRADPVDGWNRIVAAARASAGALA